MQAVMPRSTVAALCLVFATAGCLNSDDFKRWKAQFDKDRAQPTAGPRRLPKSGALRDTIGSLVSLGGMRLNRVVGYGLVVNLPGTGGGDGSVPHAG